MEEWERAALIIVSSLLVGFISVKLFCTILFGVYIIIAI